MRSAVAALLLDFDGLVCDTERSALRSWQLTYREQGLELPRGLWERMYGRRDGEELALAHLSAQLGADVNPSVVRDRRRLKLELASQEPARPGIVELLDAAAGRAIRCCVVSNSPRGWVTGHLRRLGLLERFTAVQTAQDGVSPKPSPGPYLAALAALEAVSGVGMEPGEVLAIEDSPAGFASATAAGIRCIVVPSAVAPSSTYPAAVQVLDPAVGPGPNVLDLVSQSPGRSRSRQVPTREGAAPAAP